MQLTQVRHFGTQPQQHVARQVKPHLLPDPLNSATCHTAEPTIPLTMKNAYNKRIELIAFNDNNSNSFVNGLFSCDPGREMKTGSLQPVKYALWIKILRVANGIPRELNIRKTAAVNAHCL